MPPTHTDEGIRAAIEARRRQPGLTVLVLSALTDVRRQGYSLLYRESGRARE